LVNSRTIMVSGQTVGAGEVIFLNDKHERLFWAKIKVVPRLWEQ
jgi:flagellar motor switch/type III secretory pathway protein FliN